MKKVILILLFCLLIDFDVVSQTQKDEVFCWDKDLKISWLDFKGNPSDSAFTFLGVSSTAQSAIYLECSFDESNPKNYRVSCFFDRNKSWSKDTSRLLLNHEQLHFDIYELYARKIRSTLDSLGNLKNVNSDVFYEAIDRLYLLRDDCTEKYDIETGHGISSASQERWRISISKQLLLLKEYSTESIDCEEFGN